VVSFTHREKNPDTNWMKGWVSPSAGLNALKIRKNPCPAVQPVAESHYTD